MSELKIKRTSNKKIENWRYKYDILLRLRDHEHTVLWQKFNVLLIFNSIMITILSAILILFKSEITLVQNAYFNSINIGENALESGLPPVLLFFIISCISLVAYLCSIYSFRILKGSDFWIDFYEGKLRLYEKETSDERKNESLIFGDHPTYIRKQIDNILDTPNLSEEDIEKLKRKYSEHVKKGYISTRKNMRGFIKTIVGIWGVAFVFSGTGCILLFLNIIFKQSFIVFSILSVMGSILIAVMLIGFIYGIHWWLKQHDKKENEKYIPKILGLDHDKN